jgi:hypothetical protein
MGADFAIVAVPVDVSGARFLHHAPESTTAESIPTIPAGWNLTKASFRKEDLSGLEINLLQIGRNGRALWRECLK